MDVTENKTACPKQPAARLYDIAWNNNGSTIWLSFPWLSRPKWTNAVAVRCRSSGSFGCNYPASAALATGSMGAIGAVRIAT